MRKRHLSLVLLPVVAPLVLSGCVANEPASTEAASGEAIPVEITDTTCGIDVNEVESGRVAFTLKNAGTVRNEFEILAEDKLRIVGERENLGPGTTTDYTLLLQPGNYYTACKKNMVGSLVDVRPFTVTQGSGEAVSADEQELIDQAVVNYTAYVRDQAGQLLEATQAFAKDYAAGNDDAARAAYAPARMYYERIEPTAEAFGDIDPALDEREADYQEADDTANREWTGWHPIEKDLWRPEGFTGWDEAKRQKLADKLVEDTQQLYDLVYADDFEITLSDISNGAIGLLEEVATTKITGEEEAFSHTDLYDFQANVEGARVAYGNVQEIAKQKDPELADTIEARFTALEKELDQYKEGEGYVSYEKLDEAQRRQLSDYVDALRVPLAKLTEAVLS
ncbi:putative lipoprotein involved in iron transport [Corynebacterium renale]|uniref:Iron uptake system component EfeO n=1 Tax=Corynebacterium renale TaxID=1724 RepID=A0A2A9DQG8_9CORY|nr:iron uptake system protein EfeO [Corynebacterium renale]PFG28150.1 iron uptake system component EfeO [Corynebacterium renale]SQG65259.1 putative lipoprotein involved in iron transport [Corynebacterium renale]SQI20371.1 putative lipoprotein involved in iron transport [Corynebacterium renale]